MLLLRHRRRDHQHLAAPCFLDAVLPLALILVNLVTHTGHGIISKNLSSPKSYQNEIRFNFVVLLRARALQLQLLLILLSDVGRAAITQPHRMFCMTHDS